MSELLIGYFGFVLPVETAEHLPNAHFCLCKVGFVDRFETLALSFLPGPFKHVSFWESDDSFSIEFAILKRAGVFSSIVPLKLSLPCDSVVLKIASEGALLCPQTSKADLLSVYEFSAIEEILLFISQLSISIHDSFFELAFVDFVSFLIDRHFRRRVLLFALECSILEAVLLALYERPLVDATVSKSLCPFSFWLVVSPLALVLVGLFVEKPTSSMQFVVLDVAFVDGSVGEDQNTLGVMRFSVLKHADIV